MPTREEDLRLSSTPADQLMTDEQRRLAAQAESRLAEGYDYDNQGYEPSTYEPPSYNPPPTNPEPVWVEGKTTPEATARRLEAEAEQRADEGISPFTIAIAQQTGQTPEQVLAKEIKGVNIIPGVETSHPPVIAAPVKNEQLDKFMSENIRGKDGVWVSKEFAKENVQLNTGEWIAKSSLKDLDHDQVNYLMQHGVKAFNAIGGQVLPTTGEKGFIDAEPWIKDYFKEKGWDYKGDNWLADADLKSLKGQQEAAAYGDRYIEATKAFQEEFRPKISLVEYIDRYARDQGVSLDINRALASQKEMEKVDSVIREGIASYVKQYGQRADTATMIGTAGEMILPAFRALKPEVAIKDISGGEWAASAALAVLYAAAPVAKAVPGLGLSIKTGQTIANSMKVASGVTLITTAAADTKMSPAQRVIYGAMGVLLVTTSGRALLNALIPPPKTTTTVAGMLKEMTREAAQTSKLTTQQLNDRILNSVSDDPNSARSIVTHAQAEALTYQVDAIRKEFGDSVAGKFLEYSKAQQSLLTVADRKLQLENEIPQAETYLDTLDKYISDTAKQSENPSLYGIDYLKKEQEILRQGIIGSKMELERINSDLIKSLGKDVTDKGKDLWQALHDKYMSTKTTTATATLTRLPDGSVVAVKGPAGIGYSGSQGFLGSGIDDLIDVGSIPNEALPKEYFDTLKRLIEKANDNLALERMVNPKVGEKISSAQMANLEREAFSSIPADKILALQLEYNRFTLYPETVKGLLAEAPIKNNLSSLTNDLNAIRVTRAAQERAIEALTDKGLPNRNTDAFLRYEQLERDLAESQVKEAILEKQVANGLFTWGKEVKKADTGWNAEAEAAKLTSGKPTLKIARPGGILGLSSTSVSVNLVKPLTWATEGFVDAVGKITIATVRKGEPLTVKEFEQIPEVQKIIKSIPESTPEKISQVEKDLRQVADDQAKQKQDAETGTENQSGTQTGTITAPTTGTDQGNQTKPEVKPETKTETKTQTETTSSIITTPPIETTPNKSGGEDEPSRETTKEQGDMTGAIAWKQGKRRGKPVFHVIKRPYETQSDLVTTVGSIPPGAVLATGKGSAQKSARLLHGTGPKNVNIDMGMMDVNIQSKGRNVKLLFTPDPQGKTTYPIRVGGMHKGRKPRAARARTVDMGGGIVRLGKRQHLKLR